MKSYIFKTEAQREPQIETERDKDRYRSRERKRDREVYMVGSHIYEDVITTFDIL